MTPESAITLIELAQDRQEPVVIQSEVSGSRSRPLVLGHRADSVSATKEVREPIAYRDSISSDSWAAILSRGPNTWEDR